MLHKNIKNNLGAIGCLIGPKEGDSFNFMNYKLGQMPKHWFFKGMQLKRDAFQFYEQCEKQRQLFAKALIESENFSRGFRSGELAYTVEKILEKNPTYTLPDFQVFYFLLQMSLENFFKAIFLDQNQEILGFKRLPKKLKTHNLKNLAKSTNINLSDDENAFLEKLSSLSQSYCRYPIGVECIEEDKSDFKTFDTGDKTLQCVAIDSVQDPYSDDKAMYEKIVEIHLEKPLEIMLENEMKHLEILFNEDEK